MIVASGLSFWLIPNNWAQWSYVLFSMFVALIARGGTRVLAFLNLLVLFVAPIEYAFDKHHTGILWAPTQEHLRLALAHDLLIASTAVAVAARQRGWVILATASFAVTWLLIDLAELVMSYSHWTFFWTSDLIGTGYLLCLVAAAIGQRKATVVGAAAIDGAEGA